MGCESGVKSKAAPPLVSTSATHSSPAQTSERNRYFVVLIHFEKEIEGHNMQDNMSSCGICLHEKY